MTNPRVQQLHASGAGLGHAVVWDGTTWVAGTAATGMDVVANFDDYFNLTTGTYDYEFGAADTTSLPAGWSWVNQGDSTYREVGGLASLYSAPTGGTTDATETHRMLVRALPSESTWTAVMRITSATGYPSGGDYLRAGLVLRDSSGGDYLFFGRRVASTGDVGTISADYCSSLNTVGSNLLADAITAPAAFLQVQKVSSTSYVFSASPDGIAWASAFYSADPTSHGLTLDQIGVLGGGPSGGYGNSIGLDWFRVRI